MWFVLCLFLLINVLLLLLLLLCNYLQIRSLQNHSVFILVNFLFTVEESVKVLLELNFNIHLLFYRFNLVFFHSIPMSVLSWLVSQWILDYEFWYLFLMYSVQMFFKTGSILFNEIQNSVVYKHYWYIAISECKNSHNVTEKSTSHSYLNKAIVAIDWSAPCCWNLTHKVNALSVQLW